MTLTLQPVQVRVEGGEEVAEGRLVFLGRQLVAVLVCLSGEHGEQTGQWFLEHGFGRLDTPQHPTFADLDTARAWIAARLGVAG